MFEPYCVAENEVKEVYSVEEWVQSPDEGRKDSSAALRMNRSAQHGSGKMQATSLQKYSPIRYIPE